MPKYVTGNGKHYKHIQLQFLSAEYMSMYGLTGDRESRSSFSIKEAWLPAAFPLQPSGREPFRPASCCSSSLLEVAWWAGKTSNQKVHKRNDYKDTAAEGNPNIGQ